MIEKERQELKGERYSILGIVGNPMWVQESIKILSEFQATWRKKERKRKITSWRKTKREESIEEKENNFWRNFMVAWE